MVFVRTINIVRKVNSGKLTRDRGHFNLRILLLTALSKSTLQQRAKLLSILFDNRTMQETSSIGEAFLSGETPVSVALRTAVHLLVARDKVICRGYNIGMNQNRTSGICPRYARGTKEQRDAFPLQKRKFGICCICTIHPYVKETGGLDHHLVARHLRKIVRIPHRIGELSRQLLFPQKKGDNIASDFICAHGAVCNGRLNAISARGIGSLYLSDKKDIAPHKKNGIPPQRPAT